MRELASCVISLISSNFGITINIYMCVLMTFWRHWETRKGKYCRRGTFFQIGVEWGGRRYLEQEEGWEEISASECGVAWDECVLVSSNRAARRVSQSVKARDTSSHQSTEGKETNTFLVHLLMAFWNPEGHTEHKSHKWFSSLET